MKPDEAPRPETRGALVPPRGTRPTAVGTATPPPPPKPPRRWQRRDRGFRLGAPVWLILLALGLGSLLITATALLPVLTLGAMLGGTAGLVGFLRDPDGVDARWLVISAIGGAFGAALATWFWDKPAGDSARSAAETLLLSGIIGMQVALFGGLLVITVGALVALHGPRWIARFNPRRDRESRAGA